MKRAAQSAKVVRAPIIPWERTMPAAPRDMGMVSAHGTEGRVGLVESEAEPTIILLRQQLEVLKRLSIDLPCDSPFDTSFWER